MTFLSSLTMSAHTACLPCQVTTEPIWVQHLLQGQARDRAVDAVLSLQVTSNEKHLDSLKNSGSLLQALERLAPAHRYKEPSDCAGQQLPHQGPPPWGLSLQWDSSH